MDNNEFYKTLQNNLNIPDYEYRMTRLHDMEYMLESLVTEHTLSMDDYRTYSSELSYAIHKQERRS